MFVQWFLAQYQCFSLLLGEFLLAALLVLGLSIKLTAYADRLEKSTRLSEMWIGMLLLAFVTSLPEAVNSIGSTLIQGALNLGIGNLTGSNMFNIVIIVILDVVQGPGPILLFVKDNQVFIAAGGILLMGLVGCAIALHVPFEGLASPGKYAGIAFTLAIFATFLAVTWVITHRDAKQIEKDRSSTDNKQASSSSARRSILLFAAYSIAVVLTSVWLLRTCDAIARQPVTIGSRHLILGHTFVGAFLAAVATSLPELFVSLSALRLGRVNMSVANIFGSNIMNMAFIPLMHLFAFRTAFYVDVSPASLVMLFAAIIMSTLFIFGLLIHSKKSFLFLGWEAVMILLTYLSAVYLVFRMGLS